MRDARTLVPDHQIWSLAGLDEEFEETTDETYSKGSSDRNRSPEASQPISKSLYMVIRGSRIVISVLLPETELKTSARFL